MKWQNKGHEFESLKRDIMNHDQEFYIWGYGTFGIAFYNEFKNDIRIKGFIDSKAEKWTDTGVDGLSVISPEQMRSSQRHEKILVSTGFTKNVYDVLSAWGYVRFQDYYHIDEWASYYRWIKNNAVFVNDITLGITTKCTLRCEYCNAFIPQIACPSDYPLNDIKKDLNKYFYWVDSVNILGLCGGDAMLHKEFKEILEFCGRYYPERIKNFEIYSNAVIPLNNDLITLFKKYNVIYRFTDYSICTDKQNIKQLLKQLKEEKIRYDCALFDRWYDCGYPQTSNGLSSDEELIAFCTACDRKSCHTLRDGKLFTCAMCVNADEIGYCHYDKTDYFDLDDIMRTKEEFLEYYLGYSEKGYYNYCRKCNGGPNINTHCTTSGQQKNKYT